MNMLDNLLREKSYSANIQGEWFTVQWKPDIATSEVLNIGVVIKDRSGEISLRMLDNFERVKCLYSEDALFSAELACKVAREYILSVKRFDLVIGESIHIKSNGFFQGLNAETVINRLFDTVVPLARVQNKRAVNKFSPVDRDGLYTGLKERLKDKLQLEYSLHCPVNPFINIDKGGVNHSIFLPFKKTDGIATLASAVYSDPNRVKCNLYDAQRDIELARYELKTSKSAIFFLTNASGLSEPKQAQIDEVVDTFTWYMKSKKVFIGAHSSPEDLAGEIAEWCKSKVA